jgi:VanZ family protein
MSLDHCRRASRTAMLMHLMRPDQRAARFLVLAAWMGLVSYWSGQGNLPIDQPLVADLLHGFQHRIAHLVAFGLVALLAGWAFAGAPRAAVWAVLLTSLFGAADEWHQSFTPGRHSGIDDWAWDTACAVIALFAWSRLARMRWHAYVRPYAAAAVAALFVVGIGVAVLPGLSLATGVSRASLHAVTMDVAHGAIELARSTRNVARQVRSTLAS